MKKLMTMIAAVAMSFGLFADAPGFVSGTNLNDEEVGTFAGGTESELWDGFSETDNQNKIATVAWTPALTFMQPEEYKEAGAGNSLAVKTALGNPISRSCGATAISTDAYVDMMTQFTVFDETPNFEAYDDAKIALWLQEVVENDESTGETNVWLYAGNFDGTAASYNCGDVSKYELGDWNRVTVKSINNIGTDKQAFVVFINGHPLTMAEGTYNVGALPAGATPSATVWYNQRKLFPSIQSARGVSAVAFGGQGGIDDIVFSTFAGKTDSDAEYRIFAIDPAACTVTWPTEGLVDVKIDGVSVTDAEFAAGSKLVVFADPFQDVVVSWTGDDTHKNGSYPIKSADETQVDIEDYLEEAVAKIGDEKYGTLAEAAGYAENETIVLVDDVYESVSFAVENATLDLAGFTVTGTIADEAVGAAIYVASGSLTIIDTDGNGVVNAGDEEAAVQPDAGAFTIQGGNFIGMVAGGEEFTGGTFDADPRENNSIASGYKADEVEEGVWKVVADTGVAFTVTPGANSKVAKVLVNDVDVTADIPTELNAGDTYKVTFKAENGCVFAAGETGVREGAAADEAIEIIGPDAALIVATVTDAEGAAMGSYATLTAALTAATNGCTVVLQEDTTLGKTSLSKSITLDLNSKTLTGAVGALDKYLISLNLGYALTVKDGSIVAKTDATQAAFSEIFHVYADLTVENVAIDATGLTGEGYFGGGTAAVFAVMNGNVQIKGSTSVANVNKGYLLSVGNHAGAGKGYDSRNVTINTTGMLDGDFFFAGGNVTYTAGDITGAKFYYGASRADTNRTDIAVVTTEFAISDLTGFNLTTGVGEVPTAPTEAEFKDKTYYARNGQLYATVADAEAVGQDKIVLFTDYALAENKTFANAVAVVAPAKITLGTYKLTTPNLLTDAAFMIPAKKAVKVTGEGPYTYELTDAAQPIDPTKPAEPFDKKDDADARAAEINANKATMITVPDDMASVKDSYIANVEAKVVPNASTDKFDVIVDVIESQGVKDNLAAAETTIAAKLGDVAVDDAEVSIAAIPGLYYSAREGGTVELGSETARVPATGNEVTIKLDHYEGAGFYQIKVSAAPAK